MTITETVVGKMHTLTLSDTVFDHKLSATLSGIEQHRTAMVDGLLWWVIGRKFNLLWERFQEVEQSLQTKHGHDVAHGLFIYVHTVPFYEETDERQRRIANTVANRIPELATLAEKVRDQRAQTELASVRQLAELLRLRIERPGDAGHGLEGIITTTLEQAA